MSIRVAALYALANFKADQTKNILMKFLNDKNPGIVKGAKESLQKQESAVSQKAQTVSQRLL